MSLEEKRRREKVLATSQYKWRKLDTLPPWVPEEWVVTYTPDRSDHPSSERTIKRECEEEFAALCELLEISTMQLYSTRRRKFMVPVGAIVWRKPS